MEANDLCGFTRHAAIEHAAEPEIIAALGRLLSLAQKAKLSDTIAYLAACKTLVEGRYQRRRAEMH